MRPETALVQTETIANPTSRLADVVALAEIAHDADALLSVDATFSPPPLIRSIESGADLSIQSLTKYINGHGDAMGGSVAGSRELIERLRADAQVNDESLIVHVGTGGPRVAHYPEPFRRLGHLRCSVGLEDADDLIADLAAALDETFG